MKGRPWCADLPVVDVPNSGTPKPITLILPYYENPRFLQQQMFWWGTYADHLQAQFSVVLVDDGSPTHPAADVVQSLRNDLRIRLFRIGVDVRWNWLAARNLGAHHAPEGWMLLTDMDHMLPQTTLDALVYGKHDPGVIYGFSRKEHTGEALAAHPNSWFLTREMFWKMGGYDERLSGHYGTDGEIRRRMAKTAPMQILADRLIRYEHIGDSSTTTYKRKQPVDREVKRIVSARGPGWTPKTLSFPYAEVFA